MASVNRAIILGNLGKDPEVRHLENGDAVTSFSVATTEKYKDKSGEAKEATEWHRIVAFGKLAEICGQYLNKGSQVYVEGKIVTRKYTDKDGIEKYSTEIRLERMQMLGKRDSAGAQEGRQPANQAKAIQPDFDDAEIPF